MVPISAKCISKMESPRVTISRSSADLMLVRGAVNPSVSNERVDAPYLKPWEGFFETVSRILENLGFDGEIKCLHEKRLVYCWL